MCFSGQGTGNTASLLSLSSTLCSPVCPQWVAGFSMVGGVCSLPDLLCLFVVDLTIFAWSPMALLSVFALLGHAAWYDFSYRLPPKGIVFFGSIFVSFSFLRHFVAASTFSLCFPHGQYFACVLRLLGGGGRDSLVLTS